MSTIPIDPRLRARRIEVMRMEGRRRLRVLVVLAVASSMAVAGWWVVARSPLFAVDRIEVTGVHHTSPEVVRVRAGITKGQPLVEVEMEAAKAAVAQLPWVDEVRASRDWRGTITFELTERVPVAAVPGADGWLLVDDDGRVLDVVATVPGDLVVFEGERWAASPGGWVGEAAVAGIAVAAALPAELAPRVASVLPTTDGYELALFGGGQVVLGADSDLEVKFEAVATVLSQVDLRCLDRLDVRAPTVPVLTRVPECS